MPIYEFQCQACEADFEQLFRSMSDKPRVRCPKCSGAKVSRKLSLFGMASSKSDGGSTRSSGSSCGSCRASSCTGCRR